MSQQPTLTERLISLFDHFGLTTAFVATQMSGDVADLARRCPERIAGLLLCTPSRLDSAPFCAVAARTVMIAGERGMTAEVTARAEPRLPGSRRVVLPDYDAPGWADVVADRTDAIVATLRSLSGTASIPELAASSGIHAGITFQVHGKGPVLVLLP